MAVYRDSDAVFDRISTYEYDAWGNIVETWHTSSILGIGEANPFRYRGYYYDVDTGLYYVNSRYYDPSVCRWINADGYVTTGQGILGYNMYAYCGNNPISRVDHTGAFWQELWASFTQTLQQAKSYFVMAAGFSQTDTPAIGPADLVSSAMIVGGMLVCFGIAAYNTVTAPASISKSEEKSEAIPVFPKNNGTVYYHITTPENAASIKATGVMTGSEWEGGYVYAWKTKPNKYAIENSGAHQGVVISFKTNAAFVVDMGITDFRVQMFGPVVSVVPGPIIVWDVQIVEKQK